MLNVYKSKEDYRKLCAAEPTIPIFMQAWWLDALCETGWDGVLVSSGEDIVAAMPYCLKRRYGFSIVTQPPLTQFLGPWIRPHVAKYAHQLAFQKEVMNLLIDGLPPFDHFSQNWHHCLTNWLPFYWRGFRQTTRYTYVLADLSDEQALWGGVQENIRREIRKASKRFELRVRTDLGLEAFLRLNHMTFSRQGRSLPYSDELVRRLDRACEAQTCRAMFMAEDKEGRHHAGVYMVWDKASAYYLMGGGNPELRNSGATSLCMWEAIRHAATVTQRFDFEGSMIEPIERFFRAFGAVQTPYFNIYKTPSPLLALAGQLRRG